MVKDSQAIIEALDLGARYRISFWDALIVQAANAAAVEVLYPEDLNHAQTYGSIVVEHPFLQ